MMVASRPLSAEGRPCPVCPYFALLSRWASIHGADVSILRGTVGASRSHEPAGAALAARSAARAAMSAVVARQHSDSAYREAMLFSMPDGRVPCTADVTEMFREGARALAMDASMMGAPAARIGGATDIFDALLARGVAPEVAAEQGQRLIRERGRWDSDVGFIYARPSAEAHLAMSVAMGEDCRADLESLVASLAMPGDAGHELFAQPASL